ncbi:unnamed protein product, partial [Mycena citricolor]
MRTRRETHKINGDFRERFVENCIGNFQLRRNPGLFVTEMHELHARSLLVFPHVQQQMQQPIDLVRFDQHADGLFLQCLDPSHHGGPPGLGPRPHVQPWILVVQ